MSVSLEQVDLWLAATIGSDEAALRSATAALESAQSIPSFPLFLLSLSSGSVEGGRRLAAAIYLKNLLKDRWQKRDFLPSHERHGFRNQLADTILRTDSVVIKTLAEAFSVIIDHDFVQKNNWPELVPSMKNALQGSNLLNRQGVSEIRTFNVLIAVQKMVRPFQYFMNPTVAKEPVPEQLDLIGSELFVPLFPLFQRLVEEAKLSEEYGASDNDDSLLVISKCFHLAVRAHMPSSLQLHLGNWCQCFLRVLETVQLQHKVEEIQKLLRVKTWKRTLQIFGTLVMRHRKHVDKILPNLSNVLMNLLTRMTSMTKDLHPSQERVISVAFDTISNILETGPGWRLISSHFSLLLEAAIFPALKLKEKDLSDWDEDQEEYLRKNLPLDTEFTCGWKKDHFTPRKSALNLLDLISNSKGSPTSTSKSPNSVKRKKAGKGLKSRETNGTAGELLIVPFLSKFRPPPDGSSHTSEPVINYYGVLLAYGGLQQFFEKQKTEHIHMLLQSRVLPLYSASSPSPILLANANWVLGMFASFLPEELSKEIYDALLKAFLVPDGMDMSWKPVRNSAAAALSALLEVEFKPPEWLPIVQALLEGVKSEDDDDVSVALRVFAKIADAVEEEVVPHLPAIISSIQPELCKRIPDIPEPWPEVVESGFSAIVALAQTWDSADAEADGNDTHIPNWKEGCVVIGSTISDLLEKSWLNYPEGVIEAEVSPPSSCLNDASALIAVMLRYTIEVDRVVTWRIEELLRVWSELIAEWSAWEEEEDLAVFDAIKEIILLQERFPLPHFAASPMPPPPALPVPARSILEGVISFISSAIEVAYAAATWRACKCSHALLHVSGVSFDSDDITPLLIERLSQAAGKRLLELSSHRVPLAKPLVLLIAACYVLSTNSATNVLSKIAESRTLLIWTEALADLVQSSEEPKLAVESEFKLAVAALLKLLENLFVKENCYLEFHSLKHKLLQSLLSACIQVKELEDYEEESNDEDDDENDSEEEVDDTDEDDDSEDGDQEETEEQFLERYAQKAQDLEKETLEEAEGGEEEDGQELDIGVLGLHDQMSSVYAFLENYGKQFMKEFSIPHDLLSGFLEHFPDSAKWFSC